MNKIYSFCINTICVFFTSLTFGQTLQNQMVSVNIGSIASFNNSLTTKLNAANARGAKPSISLKISSLQHLKGSVNYSKRDGKTNYIVGAIENEKDASFIITTTENMVSGKIILQNKRKAYEYFSDDSTNVFVKEVDINSVLCIDYDVSMEKTEPTSVLKQASALAIPDLQSLPGATGCIYLDFDGEFVIGTGWNSGNAINAESFGINTADITEIWQIVSEDFRPFNLNVTTNRAVFDSYPESNRGMTIITPTSFFAPPSGGVAFVGSYGASQPCWVFNQGVKTAVEAITHEVGHTLGLFHDGRLNPSEGYYTGHGDWAPIMGVGYDKSITHWSKGEYNSANNNQDDLAIITSDNRFGYRPDDHGNAISSASAIVVDETGIVSSNINKGVIETTEDVDYFSFTTSGGDISLNINTIEKYGNLDIQIRLFNSSGTEIGLYDPSGLNATVNSSLEAGKYYFLVNGTGLGNVLNDGYSDYSSLGSYFISGTITNSINFNRLPEVSITIPANNTTYTDPTLIIITATATDIDGTISKVDFFANGTLIGTSSSSSDSQYSFNWTSNLKNGVYSITAVATDNLSGKTTSSIIKLTINSSNNKSPTVLIVIPSKNQVIDEESAIVFSALGFDDDGTVVKMEFLIDGVLISSVDNSDIHTYISKMKPGSYKFSVTVTDNQGATVKDSVDFVVRKLGGDGNYTQIPNVDINNTIENQIFSAPANVRIQANASDADGTISKVEFYNGTTKLGESTSSPYEFNWNNVQAGDYKLTAVAIDNQGATDTSDVVNIKVELTTIINDALQVNETFIYPNPASDVLYIRSPEMISKEYLVQITDVKGNIVFNQNINLLNTYALNLKPFNNGLYVIKIKVGAISRTTKFEVKR